MTHSEHTPVRPLSERLIALAQTLQFAWFSGHLIQILCTLRYSMSWLRMNYYSGIAVFSYRLSFMAAALTYGIIVYKLVKGRVRTGAKFPSALLSIIDEENVHHYLMALVWLLAPQYGLAMLPFCIYSVFHVASYIQMTIIPIIYPESMPPPPSPGNSASSNSRISRHPVAQKIARFVDCYYDTFMSVVVNLEMLLWTRLFLSALLFQRRSWVLLFVYTVFIRARYSHSSHMQASFHALETRVNELVAHQGTPPALKQGWEIVKDSVRQFYAATDVAKYKGSTVPPKKTE